VVGGLEGFSGSSLRSRCVWKLFEEHVVECVVESKSHSSGNIPLFLSASILKLAGLLGKEEDVNEGYVCRYQGCATDQNALSVSSKDT
jgi:hypothetical protein